MYFYPPALTNLYGVSDIFKKGNHVYIDTRKENCFLVTRKKGLDVRFPCDDRGLYVRESTSPADCCVYNYAGTHIEGFTPREVEKEKRVQKLHHDLNVQSIVSLKVWICQNMERKIMVSFADVDLAEKIFKADVPTLKGKSTKPHPPIVNRNDVIELPDELQHNGRKLELAIDVVYINNECFLHSVDRSIQLKLLSTLGMRKKGEDH